MKKKSVTVETFLMYKPWRRAFQVLSLEQAGALILAIFDYVCDGTYELSDIAVQATFEIIKPQIDNNIEKYKERCSIAQENGKKGGAPPGNQYARKKVPQLADPEGDELCSKIVGMFNRMCISFKPVKNLTQRRRALIKARATEVSNSLEAFKELFGNMERSDFLKHNEYGFDWVLKNSENFIKTYEGKYEKPFKQSPRSDRKVLSMDASEFIMVDSTPDIYEHHI